MALVKNGKLSIHVFNNAGNALPSANAGGHYTKFFIQALHIVSDLNG
jgi:hypothetical protein